MGAEILWFRVLMAAFLASALLLVLFLRMALLRKHSLRSYSLAVSIALVYAVVVFLFLVINGEPRWSGCQSGGCMGPAYGVHLGQSTPMFVVWLGIGWFIIALTAFGMIGLGRSLFGATREIPNPDDPDAEITEQDQEGEDWDDSEEPSTKRPIGLYFVIGAVIIGFLLLSLADPAFLGLCLAITFLIGPFLGMVFLVLDITNRDPRGAAFDWRWAATTMIIVTLPYAGFMYLLFNQFTY